MSAKLGDVIGAMLDRPVAFHPVFARISGSVNAGLMLSQAVYWAKVLERTKPETDGWFYKTQAEWTEETCLSRWEQDGARKILRGLPFWEEKKRDAPPKSYFRLDLEKLAEMISQYVEKPHSRLRENLSPECGKTSNQNVEKPQSVKGTETTSENTQKVTRAQNQRPVNSPRQKGTKAQPQQVTYAQTAELTRAGEKMLATGEVRDLGELKERLKDIAAARGMERYGDPCANAADVAMRRFEGQPLFSKRPE